MTTSIAAWRYQAIKKIKNFSDTAEFEINAILSKVLQKDFAWCLANSEIELNSNALSQLEEMENELIHGTPLAYILGHIEFFGNKFFVDPSVLIPRPETEIMVEMTIEWLGEHSDSKRVVDVGTGSGAILLSVLKRFPLCFGYGIDISRKALKVAKKNANYHQKNDVSLIQMDCLSGVDTQFDVILANLPYIPQDIVSDLRVSKFEPILALDGGLDGTAIIFKLLEQIKSRLAKPGLSILEIQFDQATIMVEKTKQIFPEGNIMIVKDLAGLDRFIKIEV